MTKEILQKIENGDGLTDHELDSAIEFFTDLEHDLNLLGPEFRLAWRPVAYTLDKLRGFKSFRERRKSEQAKIS